MQQRFETYHVISQIYASARTLVVAARRRDNDATVVLKVPQPGQRGDELAANYAKEAKYRRALGQGEVEVDRHMGLPLLVIPGLGEVALRDLLRSSETLQLGTWLKIARAASQQLKELHALGVLHRDVHPGNLLWNSSTERVALVDFELAVPLIHAGAKPIDQQRLGAMLPYMAPETTGRMNVGVDERSDLYALGATLYEALLGEPPFTATDPLELAHQHMTQAPIPPHQRRADIPSIVSAMILKLLDKSPDRRYQSARGLEFDLSLAQEQFAGAGQVDHFELGRHDIPDRYQPGTGLYGRDTERMALLQALNQVRGGGRMVYIIAGYSGIGKTSLVHQLREPTLSAGGIYAEGKCDQYQRLQPYSAWARALDSIVAQILARPQAQRDVVAEKVLAAVGSNGGLLTAIVPSLEHLIGSQPVVNELGVREAQNRLDYVFVAFLGSLSAELTPLVIFLDDLQWMDRPSLDLLQAIAQSQEARKLLVVGAYRDNEVDAAHPLQEVLRVMRNEAPEVLRITTLGNLSAADIGAMIATNLNMAREAADELAATVYAKTGGNPFFSHQLLKRMADLRVLRFDEAKLRWLWDSEQLDAMPPADNVIDLLLQRLRELPERTQEMLRLGASIGVRFEPAVLTTVADCSGQDAEKALKPALKEGLLIWDAYSLKFAHDRVQQAAYDLIAPDARAALHLRIGRQLVAAHDGSLSGRQLFDTIAHFERGQASLHEPAERQRIAALSAEAAHRAQAASAHDVALRYYRLALTLAGEDAWRDDPEKHWDLYLDALRSEFNNANHDRVEKMIAVAAAHARTRLDRVVLFELECQFAVARNDQNAAIDLALQALELLDIRFALDAPGLVEQAARLRAEIRLPSQGISTLAKMAEMHEPEHLAAVRVMVSAAGAAYVMRPKLWEVLTLQMVKTTLAQGRSPLAAFAYGFYGVLLAGVYQDIDKGYAFGRLSIQLLDHYGVEPLRAKIINLFDVFVRHWKEHLRKSLEELPRGLQSGIDYGDFEYGSYNAIQHGKHQVICGCPLDEVLEQQNAYIRIIDRLKMGYHLDFAHIWRQLAINLSGRARDPLALAGDEYDADALIPRLIAQSSNFLVFNIYCTQTMLAYLLGRNEQALAAADAAAQYSNYVSGMAEIAEHNFYHSLCLLAALESGAALHNRRLLRQVARNQRRLDVWARHAPMNFLHKYKLVVAERLRRSSSPHRAARFYEQSIQGARETYYLNDQALATELYAEYMLERGSTLLAAGLIREAMVLYGRWQAYEKVRQLSKRYAHELQVVAESDTKPTNNSSDAAVNFDVQSALRASVAIASETDVDALKCRLMLILAESAGAERGLLVLKDDSEWVLAAEFDEAGTQTTESALLGASNVPQVVFAQVMRRQQSLVLDDSADSDDVWEDPYFEAHDVPSLLCLPLLHGNEVRGLLYLENRQMPRVFSPNSVKVIEILAAQAIVAIEKARLLTTLEQRVEARTQELSRAKYELEQANTSLRVSEERFRLAMRATSEGLFDWDLVSGEIFFSPGWKRMLGYGDHELGNSRDTWLGLIDTAQRDAVSSDMDAHLAGERHNIELEYRMRHRDGHSVEVLTRASIVRAQDGTALRIVGCNVDVTAEREEQAAITYQALHDLLTGLPNRVLFTERLDAARKALQRNGTPFALHLLDLDRFKKCNDTLGHSAGDEVLRQTGARIQAVLRETDTVARLGGDEFAVIQAGVSRSEDVHMVADKLIASIGQPILLKDGVVTDVGCSIGIRIVENSALSADMLIRQADIALYRSKNGGRGLATVFSDELNGSADR
ncbi:diguanylate cyclase (GGDEF)-like protein/PAS domain S-box-containing protein [Methylohalomonas lacus]|uniref:Diguanylate cyclase (GGDEF)-like protein/PAS domain S-box-containing protein n=1 Tax=Methylohalomonas lacus TaxID=398773 RepID=A0AAE3HI91_9GAMM|nr:diguanylate cyclase [Methylohalomonas lacus]MCS3902820.1 diguanylate cyclase (GGDEF)-like protein/PAS domain S-box-containing protein [Methylohalomonas lacus]